MPIPYLLTTLLYAFVALFVAADASFVSLNLVSAFLALRWVRVHFITLGIVSQVVFGLLPILVASLAKKPKPAMRWDIWLTLNVGFVALVAGFSGVNHPMIFAGGTLVFIAATLLLLQLWNVRGGDAPASLKFYITGIVLFARRHHHWHGLVAELERRTLHQSAARSAHPCQLVGLHVARFCGLACRFCADDHGTSTQYSKKYFTHLLGHELSARLVSFWVRGSAAVYLPLFQG